MIESEAGLTTRIELVPTLTQCVHTTAKREFSSALDEYLQKEEEDHDLGQRIELLRLFLESADFTQLRRRSERPLLEGRAVRFILHLEAGEARYEMAVD